MAGASRLTPAPAALLERIRPRLPDGPVAVALSGGADSAVCAWAATVSGCPTRAITADHGLPESGMLVEAAGRVARHLGISHMVVPAPAEDRSEAGLRRARYRAIESAAEPGETLLGGHTADDAAETVLGNLIRGAGAAGLAGIPATRGPWRRPLLDVSREETRAVAVELRLPFADDPGNVDASIRRSRLRIEVMPLLREFNPSVREALLRAGRLAAADDEALEGRAAAVPVRIAFGEVSWAAAALVVVPAAVASRAVRRGLRTLFHPYAGGSEDVGAVLRVAAGEAASVSVSGGLIAGREGPWVTVYDPDRLQTPAPCPVPVPGSVLFGRWRVSAEHVEAAPRRAGGRWRLALAAPEALAVRAAVAGDTIPLEDGSKSVAEALREAGVPARLRRIWPVIEQAGRMVWVVGARVAPGVAAEPGSPATVLRVGEDA